MKNRIRKEIRNELRNKIQSEHSKKNIILKNCYTFNSEMNLLLESVKIYVDSNKVYLNLRKHVIKF